MQKYTLVLIPMLLAILACGLDSMLALQAAEEPGAASTAAFETKIAQNLHGLLTQSAVPDILPTATQSLPPSATIPPISVDIKACLPDNPPERGRVVEVIDGSSIKVVLDDDGELYTVRYIGIEAPEITSEVEYFGAEASAKNAELVNGKSVTLIRDVSKKDQDERLLRYVLVGTLFVNYELVVQGYAVTAVFPPDIACSSTFLAAEEYASSARLGLWGAAPTETSVPTQGSSGSSTP